MGGRCRPQCLPQLWHAVDDTESDLITELNLNHFGRKIFADLIHIVHGEVNLAAASLDEVIEQQRSEVADFFVVGMLAEVQSLW